MMIAENLIHEVKIKYEQIKSEGCEFYHESNK